MSIPEEIPRKNKVSKCSHEHFNIYHLQQEDDPDSLEDIMGSLSSTYTDYAYKQMRNNFFKFPLYTVTAQKGIRKGIYLVSSNMIP